MDTSTNGLNGLIFTGRTVDGFAPIEPYVNSEDTQSIAQSPEMKELIDTNQYVSDFFSSGVVLRSPITCSFTTQTNPINQSIVQFADSNDSQSIVTIDTLLTVELPQSWELKITGSHLTPPDGLALHHNVLSKNKHQLSLQYTILYDDSSPIEIVRGAPLGRLIAYRPTSPPVHVRSYDESTDSQYDQLIEKKRVSEKSYSQKRNIPLTPSNITVKSL